jgi:hypothetical protein
MHRTDAARNVANLFVDKDPGAGTRGTVVDAAWLNAVQEELCNFIEDLGGTLVKGTNTQLLTTLMTKSWALAGLALQSILKGGTGGLDIGTSIASDLRILLNSVAQWTFRESDGALVSNGKQITGLPTPVAVSDGANKGWCEDTLQFAAPTITRPALNANWIAGSGDLAPGYWKDRNGVVHLVGQATAVAGGSNALFTLPVGYRPAAYRDIPGIIRTNPPTLYALYVGSTIEPLGGRTVGEIHCLDGITFLAE